MLIRGLPAELVSAKADVAELNECEEEGGFFKTGEADVKRD